MLRAVLLLLTAGVSADGVVVERADVSVEQRAGRDWCVVDTRVSTLAQVRLDALLAVIQDYDAYPKLFSRVREAHFEPVDGATLVTQTLVVEAFGTRTVNRFTLRMKVVRSPSVARLSWTQEATDGSIDSLDGSWTLEDVGGGIRVVYETRYAVPLRLFGQDIFMRLAMGGEARNTVEAVVKASLAR